MRSIQTHEAARVAREQARLDLLRPAVRERPQRFRVVDHQEVEVVWDGT